MGRSDIFANEFDLDADEFVPMPKGDVHKTKELQQVSQIIFAYLFSFFSLSAFTTLTRPTRHRTAKRAM